MPREAAGLGQTKETRAGTAADGGKRLFLQDLNFTAPVAMMPGTVGNKGGRSVFTEQIAWETRALMGP